MNGIPDDASESLSDILYPVDIGDFEESPTGKESLFEAYTAPNGNFDTLHRIAKDGVVPFFPLFRPSNIA